MVGVISEDGVVEATVARVVAAAGVSRRTFYEMFCDRDDCLLAAFQDVLDRATACIQAVHDPSVEWVLRIRGVLVGLLCFLEDEPRMGRLLIVESLGAGSVVLRSRSQTLDQLVASVDEGRDEGQSGFLVPPLAAEGVVGAVLSILHTRLQEDTPTGLLELTNPLMSTIVLAYLGPEASRRELDRPIPTRGTVPTKPPTAAYPLRDLNMRLTYRTARVLEVIAARPGCSNRTIADRAGITDQGQTSKLLRRLEHLDLIQNTNQDGHTKGQPNIWTLTPKGQHLHNTINTTQHD